MFVKILKEAGYEELLAIMDKQLVYDHVTGTFSNKIYRNRLARKGEASGYLRKDGYIGINLDGKAYLAHRLVWLQHNKTLPDYLDHINGDKADNRIQNLRAASSSDNNANTILRKDNTLGIKGVSYHKNGYYLACVAKNKKRFQRYFKISSYKDKNEALEQAIDWVKTTRENLHNEFSNHGEFV